MALNLWWLCVLAGVVLVGVEIVAPSFAVIWLALASFVTAIPVYLHAPAWIDLTVFGGTLLLFVTFGRRLAITKLFRGAKVARTNEQAVVGETGVVIERVDSVAGTGQVRIGGETWTAISEHGNVIDKGELIQVKGLKGVRLIVTEKEIGKS
ncbi:NfeD family protein [Candidatus Bipolaricaulota bacterium]